MANDQELDLLKLEVSNLQRKAKDNKIPISIFIEGKNSKNKKELITKFLDPLEPRGYHFISVNKSIFKCNGKPKILLFLEKTPSFDQIYLLDKSWYSLNISLEEIEIIEKILSSYVLIIKFLINNKKPSKLYKKIYKFNLLKEWNILNNTNKLESLKNIFLVFKNKVEQIVKEKSEKPIIYDPKINVNSPSILDTIDLNKSLTETEYKEQLEYYQKELSSLQKKLKKKKKPVIILLEGWDAAGKGGSIRRIVKKLDPRHYRIISVSAPNEREKKHHYLWRFWTHLPKYGQITIFDRTWYGRLLVERIEGFCTVGEWQNAFEEIALFESLLIKWDYILIKCWLHVDKETQLKRFEERQNNPYKQWKITEEDWRNREKWDLYRVAFDELYKKTNTDYAPWHIIEFNYKWFGRIKLLKVITETIKNNL